jgi:hypothetical protein
VVAGFIGKLPMAGMALYNLHHIAGLQELGYDVHYVEQQNGRDDYYDPQRDEMTDSVEYGVEWVEAALRHVNVGRESFSVIDIERKCHGSGWRSLQAALERADFILNIADATWFDELELCPRRIFVDGDPLFTQAAMLRSRRLAERISNYGVLFTYCSRMGKPDCSVPDAGRKWIATRPAVCTRMWATDLPPLARDLPVTTLMNWSAGGEVELRGRSYGQKGQEFERFIDLPRIARDRFAVAVGGPAPRDLLREHGWEVIDPLLVTGSLDSYRRFIARSRADFGIAKNAYVASHSGWFSDRSTCYLASGRPVLHQETGFSEWLPVGEGVFTFATMDEALLALTELNADYTRHSKAARAIAADYFEARTVIGRMLETAGLR